MGAAQQIDPEEKASELRFSRRPDLSIAAARKGSSFDIYAVSINIIRNSCPPSRLSSCACAIAEGLLIARDCSPWPSLWQATMFAVLAFDVLERSFVRDRERLNSLLRSPDLRRFILDWTTDLVGKVESEYSLDSGAEHRLLTSGRMAYLNAIGKANKFLARGHLCSGGIDWFEQILAGLTRLVLSNHSYNEQVLITTAICAISVPLYGCTREECPKKKDVILETALDMGFRHKDLMRLFLNRLRESRIKDKGTYMSMFFSQFDASIEDKRSGMEDLTCHDHFVDLGGVISIVETIRDAFSHPMDNPSGFTAEHASVIDVNAIGYGFHLLSNVLIMADDLRPLRQALRSGIMKALVFVSLPQVYTLIARKFQASIQCFIEMFTHALVIRQNLKEVRRALMWYRHFSGTCECGECYGIEKLLQRSDTADDWAKLFSELKRTQIDYKLLQSQRKSEQVSCGNPSCTVQGTRRTLHNCAGCSMALFCSSECQSVTWNKHGHRDLCFKYQELTQSLGLKPKDMYFIARRAQEDVRRHAYAIVNRYKMQGNDISLDKHGFSVTYWLGHHVGDPVVVGMVRKPVPGDLLKIAPHCTPMKCPVVWPAETLTRSTTTTTDEDIAERSGHFEDEVEIHFVVGGSVKVLYVETNISWAALEGRECTCCRLHHGFIGVRDSDGCLLHGGN